MQKLDIAALDLILKEARTHSHWSGKPVEDSLLREAVELMKMGPTSANCEPIRILFLRSKQSKERLKPLLAPGNVEKTMAAPVTALLAYDLEFHERLPRLFPHADARSWFAGKPSFIQETAFRNASLQAAYLIIALRALGLDCGPMTGFDAEKANAEFFPNSSVRANILVNIGYGEADKLHTRLPRLDFEEIARIL